MVQMMMMKLTLSKFPLRLQRLRPPRARRREDEEDEGSPCLFVTVSSQCTTRCHHAAITQHTLPSRRISHPCLCVFMLLPCFMQKTCLLCGKVRKRVLFLSSSPLLVCVRARAARFLRCFAGKACRLHPPTPPPPAHITAKYLKSNTDMQTNKRSHCITNATQFIVFFCCEICFFFQSC